MSVPAPPADDADVPRFLAELGVPGLVDAHVHFLPDNVMDKVWAYFDLAGSHYGTEWPIHYRTPAADRVATLRELGVVAFAPLVYPHRPGMGRWLTEWVAAFAAATPGAVPTATLYPEPDVADYLGRAVAAGARVVKVHVQVGAFDPRDPLLRPGGGAAAVAGVPAEELAGEREKLFKRRREDLLVFTRWALVMFRFEKELYADPDRDDLNRVWWDLVEELQGVPRPPGRDEPDWAAKIHVATAPVYYHNYVLGNLIAAQLRNYLETHITQGPFYENEVAGRYLLESFFGPGARENWRDTVLRATGEHLNPDHFVKSLR